MRKLEQNTTDIYSQGIGTRTAALYMAWAQQFESKGMNEQADAVYQKAMENQAQPAYTFLLQVHTHLSSVCMGSFSFGSIF
uniref:BUB1 N-terminal domain-containing protein n=1 Tax=Mastacembelus armatus TaxID=205130 RepID=A0A7N8WL01_9TELE